MHLTITKRISDEMALLNFHITGKDQAGIYIDGIRYGRIYEEFPLFYLNLIILISFHLGLP